MSEEKKSALSFPCDFVIKIFGLAGEEFETEAMEIIKKHQKDLHPTSQSRPSKDGKYVAMSVKVHVNNQAELDAIYQDLTNSPLVLMAL